MTLSSEQRHPCPKNGCPAMLPFSTLACKPHWFSLPPTLRNRINGTWRSGDLVAYVQARRDAETFLNGTPR